MRFDRDMLQLQWRSLVCLCFSLFVDSVLSQTKIPLSSKLSVSDNTSWVSENGDFALGFFAVSNNPNLYSFGIRFSSDSIPPEKRHVVWVAGADLAVGNGSFFELDGNGEMSLFDSAKRVNVWTTEAYRLTGNGESAYLYDNGNFAVVSEEGKSVIWQSFDFPSDTLLPEQSFTASHVLRAASEGSVSSYYSLFMNSSGSMNLRWDSHVVYWKTENPVGSNLTASLSSKGVFEIRNRRSEIVWSVFAEDHDDPFRYRFLRLDKDGNLRLYSWTGDSWRSVWRAVENRCDVFATCGKRGICVRDGCECPFELRNDSASPSCLIPFPNRCKSGFYMMNYRQMSLYAIYPPSNEFVSRTSLSKCEQSCLDDPLCTAATYANDGTALCLVKKTPYVSGYADPSLRSVSFVKRCSDPVAVNPYRRETPGVKAGGELKSGRFCLPCLAGAVSGTTVLLVAAQFGVVLFVYRRRRVALMKKLSCKNPSGLITLSFSEIKDATKNFADPIGPTVFRATLPPNRTVAVKEVDSTEPDRKFRVAAGKIGTIHHKSLARLEAYSCEMGRRFLVYEFAENGSVGSALTDPKLGKRLTWQKRVEICLSVARAISYLHTECREFVTHGNVKVENVVLDGNFAAKLTELGIYRSSASAESDVAGFGYTVLVLVTGCNDSIEDLTRWTYKEWAEGNSGNVIDRRISRSAGPDEIDRVLRIAFWCLQADERMRPSMKEVVKVLEGTLSVDPPPPPFSGPRRVGDDEDGDESSEAGSEPDSRRF